MLVTQCRPLGSFTLDVVMCIAGHHRTASNVNGLLLICQICDRTCDNYLWVRLHVNGLGVSGGFTSPLIFSIRVFWAWSVAYSTTFISKVFVVCVHGHIHICLTTSEQMQQSMCTSDDAWQQTSLLRCETNLHLDNHIRNRQKCALPDITTWHPVWMDPYSFARVVTKRVIITCE